MARIAGVDLPREKRVEIGLTYIYGIGVASSNSILAEWSYSEGKQRYIPICVKTEFVDGEKIKADTYYSLKGGVFVEWIND